MTRAIGARSSVALWAGVLTFAALAAGVPLGLTTGQGALGTTEQVAILLPFAVVGVVVVAKQPRNPVGYLLLSMGLVSALLTDVGLYGALRFREGYDGLPLGRLILHVKTGHIYEPELAAMADLCGLAAPARQ